MEHILSERVARLEEQMKTQVEATKELKTSNNELTDAVRELTDLLNQAKGARWLLTTIISIGAIIGGIVAWVAAKFQFFVGVK